MSKIYRIRVILDAEEDVLRDIEIAADLSLDSMHQAIVSAFGFDGKDMSSFYKTDNDWTQGEEIPLMAMDDETIPMSDLKIKSVLKKPHDKLIYVYNYMLMWTFFVELSGAQDASSEMPGHKVVFSSGALPAKAPEKHFESEKSKFEFAKLPDAEADSDGDNDDDLYDQDGEDGYFDEEDDYFDRDYR